MLIYEKERSNVDNYLYHQDDINLNFVYHLHNSYEFMVCLDGEIEICVDTMTYILKKHQCFLIPPLMVHSYKTPVYSHSYLCVFSQSFIPDYHGTYKDLFPEKPIFELSEPLKLIGILKAQADPYSIKSVLYQILSCQIKDSNFSYHKQRSYPIINELIEYIENHYHEELTLKEIALQMGYAYNYISSIFNSIFGTNFMDLLNSYRILKAQQLLISENISIAEVSEKCGYSCVRSFNRNFIKYTHTKPSEFKKGQMK